jgi:thiopeptide-type bacteriocin biosynthesis protein
MADDHDWIALHVFYAANANPVLVNCVGPLTTELQEKGLLAKWFFIRYWLEGPHIRLRLLPSAPEHADEVRRTAEERLTAFLARRPALYEEDRDNSADLYKNMYLAEYSQEQWDADYGRDGDMPFRDNNSVHLMSYDREYSRYGGPAAMELAETHFQRSSEYVLHLVETTNVHMRTALLGQSAQLMLTLCLAFLRDEQSAADFLVRYRTMWENSYQESSEDQHERFDASYERMRERLVQRARQVRDAVQGSPGAVPTEAERAWIAHARDLRDDIVRLAEQGEVVLRDGVRPEPDAALAVVLSSYVHMSNNRLGASILDEIYLSYVLRKALLEAAQAAPDEAAQSVPEPAAR